MESGHEFFEHSVILTEGCRMLKILDEKVLRSDNEIEDLYKNCKYLCIIDGYDRFADNNGYLYCISTSEDSLGLLLNERTRLQQEGKCCVIGGSYNNGGAIGVQYVLEG